ncbi:tetratricopeptide (TPR) repeat protein [Lewinella marina]|uniref:TM2 domain-containing protein n=1 Tax=Neolewinella marina TaxID=438751 RepID=A0A2G0CH87_9BACT|nr:NINE protein [Neolewinella marina]NJB86184.1 tetratricopeptide (TPR) repeat protein [Neolewinella marina]PHK99339.1 hypothetical protein CGL56_07765 [Neolewinella marina]
MKEKTIAAILAFFGGIVGLQRFYLGQKGLGMAHLFFFVLALSAGPSPFTIMLISLAAIFGIIDAITLLSMERREFDLKYNQPVAQATPHAGPAAPPYNTGSMTDRERRFQERQRQRAEMERERERRDKERNNQRTEPVPQRAGRRDAGRADRERGVHYFKDYEYRRAIEAFQKALGKNPRDVAAHFNIACAYSVEEEADRAFYHLDRAVALGFDDFDRIRNHDSLAYLRIQPAFPAFERNNFRLATAEPQRVPNTEDPLVASDTEGAPAPAAPVHDELLEQLQRLARLREKGLLTEVEFATQKRRLLG